MTSPTTVGTADETYAATEPAGSGPGVPFGRVLHVELRKMVDTRAGLWMLIVMGAISVVVVTAVLIWGDDSDFTLESFLQLNALVLVLLLPIVGIMAATSEWSQRTGLVTFTLEPRRGRVVVAKVLAAVLLGLGLIAVAFLASAAAQLVAVAVHGVDGGWSLSWGVGLGLVLALTIFVLQGVAFGFAVLNTAVAIVASLVLPTVWSIASGLISWLEKAGAWLDLNRVTDPLTTGAMHGEDWAHLATSAAVWIGVPMAVGVWRVLTREVK